MDVKLHELLSSLPDREFNEKMLFRLFNMAYDDKYVDRMGRNGYGNDIDSYDYLLLDPVSEGVEDIDTLYKYIVNMYKDKLCVYKMCGKKKVIALIKPKSLTLNDILKENS